MRPFVTLLAAPSLYKARSKTFIVVACLCLYPMMCGSVETINEYPMMCGLVDVPNREIYCGCTIISNHYVFTAAHCVVNRDRGSVEVILGIESVSDLTGTQTVGISSYKMHEKFQVGAFKKSNDIAILTLNTPITFGDNIQPTNLPADNSNNYSGLTCEISGWGRTGLPNILPDTLQKLSTKVISTSECQSLLSNVIGVKISDNHICVFFSGDASDIVS